MIEIIIPYLEPRPEDLELVRTMKHMQEEFMKLPELPPARDHSTLFYDQLLAEAAQRRLDTFFWYGYLNCSAFNG